MAIKEVWITSAENEIDVHDAVCLALSLRRTLTRRNIVVIYGTALSPSSLKLLRSEFDMALPLEKKQNDEGLFEELVNAYLERIHVFQRGIFISSSILILANIDSMFDYLFDESPTHEELLQSLEYDDDKEIGVRLSTSVCAISPESRIDGHRQELNVKTATLLSHWGLDASKGNLSKTMGKTVRIIKMPVGYTQEKDNYASSRLETTLGNLNQVISQFVANVQRKVLSTRQNTKEKMEHIERIIPLEKMNEDPIAIIGMACRFPASNNIEEFWDLIMGNGLATSSIPEWRWIEDHVKESTPESKLSKGGFLKCPIDEFDGKFFGMSPKELEFTDPQARMLLEVSWEALEDAAVDPNSLKGTQTGIFTGAWTRDYVDMINKTGFEEREFFRSYMGNGYGAIAGRMAHFYRTTGSNIATESGCSSSIVSVGLAIKSLRRGDTCMALACGVNLLLQPYEQHFMAAFCSADGICKTFDAAANGFGRAEGCGVLVLKRLSDAKRDGDNIRAVIRGYGEAQEGLSRSLGTPTVDVEAMAMSLALKNAEVEPTEVSFVEAHGTGTPVGDPMEMEAITKVYSKGREEPLLVTSVKTNVGHTESCSGITGMIKTVLALERQVIPPHRALDTLNPSIDLSKTPMTIPLVPTSWPKKENRRRIAGVSSFGITGTDAHVILEEAPEDSPDEKSMAFPPLFVLALSARNEAALKELFTKYDELIIKSPNNTNWGNVTFTANIGRAHFPEFRGALVASDMKDAARALERNAFEIRKCPPMSKRSKIVFLFTGQGSQYLGMAKEVYETSIDFKRTFDKCDRFLEKNYDIHIKRALWESGKDSSDHQLLLHQTLYSQTAIFVVDYCLAELWKKWGIHPDVVLGHSLGEYAAACVAGILSLEDALKLVAERSRLIDGLPRGKMMVLNVDAVKAKQLLKKSGTDASLDLAAMNSPEQTTIAGKEESILTLKRFCENNGVKSHILEATHAFHSEMMDPALPQLRKVARSIDYKTSSATFLSGMEGKEVTSIDAEYWVRHTRNAVNFTKACESLGINETGIICVEVGPQPILSSFVARNLESNAISAPTLLPSLRRNQSDWKTLMGSLAKLYTLGHDVEWKGLYSHLEVKKLSGLPTYPFQRKKFWFEKPKNKESDGLLFSGNQIHPLVNFRFPSASSAKIFQSRLSLEKESYIKDHQIGNHVIFPGAGYVEMVLAAGYSSTLGEFEDFHLPRWPIHIRDLRVEAPLGIKEKEEVYLQTIITPPEVLLGSSEGSSWSTVTIHRRQEDASGTKSWVRHASAKFSSSFSNETSLTDTEAINVEGILNSLASEETSNFYEDCKRVGLNFGTSFRSLRRLWRTKSNESKGLLAEIVSPQSATSYFSHPVAIDAMLQAIIASEEEPLTHVTVPVHINHFQWISGPSEISEHLYVHVNCTGSAAEEKTAVLLDGTGKNVLAVMKGVTKVLTTTSIIDNALQSQKLILPQLFEEEWVPIKSKQFVEESTSIPLNLLESLDTSFTELEKNQTALTNEEMAEKNLLNELMGLQSLQAILELGLPATTNGDTTIDVHQFAKQAKVSPNCLLATRRFFEIAGTFTPYISKQAENEWTFQLNRNLPSTGEIEHRISEIEHLMNHFLVEVECIRSVASKTAEVLQGKDSILPILFGEKGYAKKTYTEYKTACQANSLLAQTIQLLCDQLKGSDHRSIRVLEVGGGTGGTTNSILPVLEESGIEYFYTFTDVSGSFLQTTETTLSQWRDRVEFKTLDIEKDPKVQGFVHESYDIIVASHVLHATRIMNETVANVRHLLRPNGLVFLVEVFEPCPVIDMIFGLVNGYWMFEDFDIRPLHCIVPKAVWPKLLRSSGFQSSTLLKIPAEEGGLIIAQANPENYIYSAPSSSLKANVWILDSNSSAPEDKDEDYKQQVQLQLERNGRRVVSLENHEIDGTLKKLLEGGHVEGILFASISRTSQVEPARQFLQTIQSILTCSTVGSPKLVLVTEGSVFVGDDSSDGSPFGGALWGMSRSFRSENPSFDCLNIDLDPYGTLEGNVTNLVRRLWSAKDDFIAVREGNKSYAARLKKLKLTNTNTTALALPQNSPRFGLIFPKTNAISDLTFAAQGRREVTGNQVEVELKATGLNFRDLFSVLKPSKAFEKNAAVGTDMAGIVSAVGDKTTSLKVGDRVFGAFFQFGGLPSHVVVAEDVVMKIPDHLTFADASTLPAVFNTAYYCLIDVADLKKEETVLIHTASGGVGLAAIQVARNAGAKIIATAGSRRKRAYLREVMGIENVFHSRDLSYEQDIMRVTEGRGVDVVLNSLTGPGFKEASLNVCCPKNARFIEMSKLNVWTEDEVRQLRPDIYYKVVDLTAVSQDTWKHLLTNLVVALNAGNLSPLPHETFEAVEIRGALIHLQKARHIGKIVCKYPEQSDDGERRRHLLFNDRSSYLITGGLGGIGLEAAKWMAISEGAKFVILCGRSPPSEKAKKVIAELNAMGKVVVGLQVDVGSWDNCKNLVEKINNGGMISPEDNKIFPPLRGIQHAAGCLSDGTFPNQTWAKYEEAFNGKVKGAWNLHQLTKNATFPLEHFVMYSSIAAIFGAMGQSNHAAGNAFLDALAHFRNARGLPATSVNWGQWGQIGVAADLNLSFCSPFTPLQGFSSLKELLRNHKSQAVVVEGDFSKILTLFLWIDRSGYARSIQLSNSNKSGSGGAKLVPHTIMTNEKFWEVVEECKGQATGQAKEMMERTLQKLLIQIISQILKLDENEGLDIHQNLQEMGLDSLMMVELKNILQGILSPQITLTASVLSEANTISKLVKKLHEMILCVAEEELSEEEQVELILSEATLPKDISVTDIVSSADFSGNYLQILFTGPLASQLSLCVLENLSRRSNIQQITILTEDEREKELFLSNNAIESKIDKVKCQVTATTEDSSKEDTLGLTSEEFDKLASNVDGIVDLSFSSSGTETPAGIKKMAHKTKSLLQFASHKKLKFVCHITRLLPQKKAKDISILYETLPSVSKEELQRYADRGYPSSQFVSECLLKQAVDERGISCKVFRVPHLSGDSLTGQFQMTEGHIFVRYLNYIRVGKIPAVPVPFAVVPVNQAADLILRVFLDPTNSKDTADLTVFSLSNPHKYSFKDFFEVSEELGRPVRAVELEEFLADKNSLIETVAYTFGDPLENVGLESSAYSKLADASADQIIPCNNFKRVLDDFENQVETPLAILRRDLKYAQDSGLFQKYLMTQNE